MIKYSTLTFDIYANDEEEPYSFIINNINIIPLISNKMVMINGNSNIRFPEEHKTIISPYYYKLTLNTDFQFSIQNPQHQTILKDKIILYCTSEEVAIATQINNLILFYKKKNRLE